jgi:hypothetical protein
MIICQGQQGRPKRHTQDTQFVHLLVHFSSQQVLQNQRADCSRDSSPSIARCYSAGKLCYRSTRTDDVAPLRGRAIGNEVLYPYSRTFSTWAAHYGGLRGVLSTNRGRNSPMNCHHVSTTPPARAQVPLYIMPRLRPSWTLGYTHHAPKLGDHRCKTNAHKGHCPHQDARTVSLPLIFAALQIKSC